MTTETILMVACGLVLGLALGWLIARVKDSGERVAGLEWRMNRLERRGLQSAPSLPDILSGLVTTPPRGEADGDG